MLFGRRRTLRDRLCDERDALSAALFADPFCGVAVLDLAGLVLRAGPLLRSLAGSPDLTRPGASMSALFGPDMRETAMAALLRVARDGAEESFVARLPGATVRISLRGLSEPSGPVEAVLLRALDISPRLLLEKQVAVSQRMQEVGQLTGGVAHDFNNLLTTLIGAADAIVQRPGLDVETTDDARQIRASALRGADLVHQLQAFGRQQTLQPRAVKVNSAVTALGDMLRRLLAGGIRLQLELEQPGRAVHIDPTQLDRALMNLAMNARQAMAAGGVLTLRSRHDTLLRPHAGIPDTVPPGRYVILDVEDTGPGISADLLERIFEPFFTTRREAGGNGLGLSTVHGIVRQSGGYLTVESRLGEGTRMRIHLPRWDGEAVEAPPPPQIATRPPLTGARLVLLVEDEPSVLRLAERALARDGWTVLSAPDAEAALEMLRAEPAPIAAVVTDMMMPGMDGATLVRTLRQLPGLGDLPAILVSGYAEASLRGEVAGTASVFMAKPYGMKVLAAQLHQVVQAHAERQLAD
jgi:two-component system cell cycle sensor histidine kinase/response regulator CckA